VLNLFYALGCLVGLPPAQLQNVCGDPDWGSMQAVSTYIKTTQYPSAGLCASFVTIPISTATAV
jgi:hypothetical protein